jgi:ActR/RegA family two-component response regulator
MTAVVPKSGLRKKSILIVEDNYNVQTLLAELARTLGFDVTTAASRREATRVIDLQAFDIAIVDMRLVESDTRNRDGIAILKYLRDKNEGTKSIFLTGYGEFSDAIEAAYEVKAFYVMEKGPQMEEKYRSTLLKAANTEPQNKYKSSVSIWSGTDDPVQWGTRMSAVLKPSGGIQVLNDLLDELAKTLHPLFRRATDNGLQKTDDASLIAGLYWSRGVGGPVIVAISREQLPSPIPISNQWPKELRPIDPPLYEASKKNLSAAIIKCDGVDNTEFDVACTYLE